MISFGVQMFWKDFANNNWNSFFFLVYIVDELYFEFPVHAT